MPQPYNPSNIQASWAQTMRDLELAFDRWGVAEWQVRPLREPDGRAHLSGEPANVTLDYVQRGQAVHLEMGKHPYYRQNLRVIFYAVESLRLNELRGLTDVVQSAYLQLAAPRQKRDPWDVLGLRPGASPGLIDAAFRELSKARHPDAPGGSHDAFVELQAAYDEAKAAATAGAPS